MSNVNAEIKMQGNDDAWFTANASVVFADNIQIFHNDGRYKFTDGVTALSALPFLGGNGGASGLSDVLSINNSTGNTSINSPNGNNKLNVIDGEVSLIYDGTNEGYLNISELKAYVKHSSLIDLDAPEVRVSSLTASQIVETDLNNNLISAAKNSAYNLNLGTTAGTVLEGNRISQTITSGVTDKAPSEDTVLDALDLKAGNLIYKINTEITHTGTIAETILNPSTFLSGFQANDFLMIDLRFAAINNANTKIIKIYVNTSHSLVGATLIARTAVGTNTSGYTWLNREVKFLNSLSSSSVFSPNINYTTDQSGASNVSPTTLNFDFSAGCYFIITGILNVSEGDTITIRSVKVKIIR